jgi:putative SOS response-associated peptidase YedK
MPVILNPDDYDLWLDPGMTDTAAASDTRRALNEPLSGQHTHQ